jgi:hypothetical protein
MVPIPFRVYHPFVHLRLRIPLTRRFAVKCRSCLRENFLQHHNLAAQGHEVWLMPAQYGAKPRRDPSPLTGLPELPRSRPAEMASARPMNDIMGDS